MLNRLMGNYLVEKEYITQEQLEQLLPVPHDLSADIEVIAVIRKALTAAQVDELLDKKENLSVRFGEFAVEEGLITDDRLDELIALESNPFMRFMQLLLNHQFLRIEQLLPTLHSFQEESGYTEEHLESLILDDLEEIIKIFVPTEDTILQELTGTLIQTMKRLIDKEVYLDRAYFADSMQLDHYACQRISGDMNLTLYISGADSQLLGLANYFAGNHYDSIGEDALDNVSEFINCVNGLFATNASYDDVMVDMNSPEYSMEGRCLNENRLLVIPIHANNCSFCAIYEIYQ